jgi:eukaryotic-like serine/threonine-protein kinase
MLQVKSKSRFTKSLTRAFLILGLLVAFLAPRWGGLDYIDGKMFQMGTWLLPAPDVSDDIYTINLSSGFMKKPEEIKQLRLALKRLKKYKSASVTLLSSRLPALDYQYKESKKDSKKKSKKKSAKEDKQKDEWGLTQGELTKLAWMLKKNKVLMGVPVTKQESHALIKNDNESIENYLQGLIFTKVSPANIRSYQYNYSYKVFPYVEHSLLSHKIPLIWMNNDSKIIPGLVLGIMKQLRRTKSYNWFKSEGVKLGSKLYPTDYAGDVAGYFSVSGQAKTKKINIEDLLSLSSRKIKNKIFIIGDDSEAIASVANDLTSIMSGAVYHAPAWTSWAKKLAFIIAFVYLAFFIFKLQKHTSYLLSVLLLFGALVFQYGLLLVQSIWLPLISLYSFLILGHLMMRLKKSMDLKMDSLRLRTHEALWHLGQYQYENGDHDRALTNLLKCSPTLDVLETMYNIGLGFERRRQYDKALHLYSELDVRDGNYKDVKKRLHTLSDVSGNHTTILSPVQAAQTLVMPDMGLQLPVFGRYEIERELGRGAMGVVYLGKDPKINRQVAIKTLDYSQFSENEIKTIKSRFFREAEAAGRLNHNNIVTVYDVGEEEGFAFIAMDYVKGMSLGEFSRPDTLLPVKDVYEIIAEVAETLDYAHSQNIVHRDIKPSNIMYEPDTHKIKVTDFGIARITDSVRTRTGSFMGSPSYMAPEQMTGANVDSHADIYSLGVSFYQLLTGFLPFEADSIGNLAYIITNEKHKPVRDVRPDLPASASRIINKALQKQPKDRYDTGMDMADAIKRGMPKD